MKGLSKRKRMAFSFSEYLHSFQRYSSFCSNIDNVANRFSTKIHHKIKNISGNIEVMLLKLGTNNVSRVRNKMTPIMTFPWYYSRPNISIFVQIRRGRHTYLKRTKCPYCPMSPHQLMGANDVRFRQKMRMSIEHNIDPKEKLLPGQQHSRRHFVLPELYYWCQV